MMKCAESAEKSEHAKRLLRDPEFVAPNPTRGCMRFLHKHPAPVLSFIESTGVGSVESGLEKVGIPNLFKSWGRRSSKLSRA